MVNKASGSIKFMEFLLVEKLFTSQKRLCPMELVCSSASIFGFHDHEFSFDDFTKGSRVAKQN
jgi:hypothetical protein